jgi:hypothetical protein
MTDNPVEIGDHDVTGALRLIAEGIPTGGRVKGPDGAPIDLRVAPGVNAVCGQLRLDNPEMGNKEARELAGAIRDVGFHHPAVARYRIEEMFIPSDNCPICDTDWNSKLSNNLVVEKKVTPDILSLNLGDGASSAADLIGRAIVVACRSCSLRFRVIHFVQAMVPDEDGKGAEITVVVLNGFVPVAPRALIPKMADLWEQTSGDATLYRMRTAELFTQWAKAEPLEAAKWGGVKRPISTLLGANGLPISS